MVSATTNFEQSIREEKTNIEIAEQYLDMISLDSGDRQASEHDDAAQLTTLHSAKGLEFKLVLMTGLEETLFPHGRSMENPGLGFPLIVHEEIRSLQDQSLKPI